MPRDLFADVQHPVARVGTRSRYTVSLSMAAHAAAVLAIVGATILGPVVLPGLATSDLTYTAVVVPPPPPAPRAPSDPPPAEPKSNAAPTVAPDGVAPEPDVPFDAALTTEPGTGPVLGVTRFDAVVGEPPPSPPPVAQTPVRPVGTIRPPTKVRDIAPVYPAIAQAARVEGTVILEAIIDIEGRVQSVRVLRSPPMLAEAAVTAVRQWQYTPTLLNGTPVPVIMSVTVTFQLR